MPRIVTPAVIVPRFSTFVCASAMTYATLPVDVSAFEEGRITGWRGPVGGSGGQFGFSFQESTDRNKWTTCAGTVNDDDPGSGDGKLYSPNFSKKWFRMLVLVSGTNGMATCWAQGFFINRQE